jgi:hypothetical protein
MKRILFLLLVLAVALAAGAEEQFSDITIKVVKEETGKPVKYAAVVLHMVDAKGHEEGGGINLKTDHEGVTAFHNIPYGKLRIQVIARYRQTFGQDYEINQPKQDFVIKLKPPASQYSIYDDPNANPKKN